MQGSTLRTLALVGLACSAACNSATQSSTHDYGGSAILLSAPVIAGAGTVNITVSVHDSDGKAVQSAAVQVAVDGLSVVQVNSTTDASGNATASVVNPTTVGQHTVTASVTHGSTPVALNANNSLQVLSPVTANGNDVSVGTPLNVQAAAFAAGSLNPRYTGTVAFTSSDSTATLPANYTFTAADHGVKTWQSSLLFQTPGQQTVTAVDTATGAVLGKQTFQVAAPPVGTLVLTALPQTSAVAGTAFSATLSVQDASGHAVTNYQRRVTFTSSDPQAALPAPVTFSLTDAGVKTVQLTLKTAGSQTVTASDAAVSGTPGAVAVLPANAAGFKVSTPTNALAAGADGNVLLQANDAYGNVALGYRGTVSFTATGGGAVTLPDDYTFTATDNGQHTFNNVSLCGAGPATITATDTAAASLHGSTGTLTVSPSAATHLLVVPSNPNWVAGDANNSLAIQGVDDCGNVNPSYVGLGGLTTTDLVRDSAIEQLTWEIAAGSGGQTTVSDPTLFLVTAGPQVFTANDAGTSGYVGTGNVNVLPANANSFRLSFAESPGFVGHLNSVTVDTIDVYGNPTPSYAGGSVALSSTDSNTVFPAAYTATAADSGHIVLGDANFLYTGTQTVTVGDGHITGNAEIAVHRVRQLASHLGYTVCATMDDGQDMKCWGYYGNGASLTGSGQSRGKLPSDMGPELPLAQLGTGVQAAKIYTGDGHSCLIHQGAANDPNNGKVKCWGKNDYGQLGLGDTTQRGDSASTSGDNLPFLDLGTGRTAVDMALGDSHSCAILDNGKMVCWGSNDNGELGIDSSSRVGNGTGQMGDALVAVKLPTGRTAVEAAGGEYHTCVLMDDHNTLCWGYVNNGESGTGTASEKVGINSGDMASLVAIDFGSGRKATHLAAGNYYSCAILNDGAVKCWGYGGDGQLGSQLSSGETKIGTNGGTSVAAFPDVPLQTGRTARKISLGNKHSCALLDDGTVTCWGNNDNGELGLDNSTAQGTNANPMPIAPIKLGTGLTARDVVSGSYYTCAILSNDTVKCWGYNGDGQVGIGVGNQKLGNDSNNPIMGDTLPSVNLY